VKREDVRVVEPRGNLDLAQKTVGAERGGQLGVEDLERNLAIVLQIVGEVNRGHPASAELTLDFVLVR
jgi:hypothetical protein